MSLCIVAPAYAQTPMEWRRIGNSAFEAGLAGIATGPVSRVWFSPDGGTLYAQTRSGKLWQTNDFQAWQPAATSAIPARTPATLDAAPEPAALLQRAGASRYYALGRFVHRSDNGGGAWSNLTGYRDLSILGGGLSDLAVSPTDPDQVVVAGEFGVFRSLDAGATWSSLNDTLANLPARRLTALPDGLRALQASWTTPTGETLHVQWAPGERTSWRLAEMPADADRQRAATSLGVSISAFTRSGDHLYAGLNDGRIFASSDRGRSWQLYNAPLESGAVTAITANGPLAVATVTQKSLRYRAPRILRTATAGRIWDDVSSDLPAGNFTGVSVHWASGTVYVAGEPGLFSTIADLQNLTLPGKWERHAGFPNATPLDVQLDAAGNQIYVLLEGFGVYATLAPHRLRQLQVVNAADYSMRAAAPGGLLSILGARIDRVRAGSLNVPVLGASETETQIQVPFEASGSGLNLTLEQAGRVREVDVPLEEISPVVFVDKDGAPLLLDADSGTPLDAAHPARGGARLQILMSGLGAVTPAWPTAMAAPAENPPRVSAPVQAFVDRVPVEVLRATLAPTYVGFYLVEIQLPRILNLGPAELYLTVGSKDSNRVRVYLEP
ncbi:MAG: hypothetical protein JNK87_05195 [Bryobacterales bacterium]|nr:hypothetical protein [Bryobacterales bacterium]